MIQEIQRLLDEYLSWLKDKTVLREIDGWVEVTTPYVDRHNDYLQIYVKQENSGYLLSDDGYIIKDLISSGCKLDSPKRQDLLRMTLNGFGVKLEGEDLVTHASASNFAFRKHNLVQAMVAVNDLFYLATPVVASIFMEDVASWFDLLEIRYTQYVKFSGKTGYDHMFDFVIPKSKVQPERIVKAINRPNSDSAKALAFAWIDTKEVRPPDARAYAFLNDSEHIPPVAVVDALKSYEVHPILWSKRDEAREELAS